MPVMRPMQGQITISYRRGNGKRASLNTVRHNLMGGRMQIINTLHPYGVAAMPLDPGPHGIQAVAQIGDFRFTRGIDNFCFAACQHRRHQRIFSTANRHHRK